MDGTGRGRVVVSEQPLSDMKRGRVRPPYVRLYPTISRNEEMGIIHSWEEADVSLVGFLHIEVEGLVVDLQPRMGWDCR